MLFSPKLLLIPMLAALLGCSPKFEGEIEFKNSSNTELWVDVAGFDRRVGCGALGAGKSATTALDNTVATKLPDKIVLTWNKFGDAKQSTEVLLPEAALQARTGILLFEFTPDGKWSSAYLEKQD